MVTVKPGSGLSQCDWREKISPTADSIVESRRLEDTIRNWEIVMEKCLQY